MSSFQLINLANSTPAIASPRPRADVQARSVAIPGSAVAKGCRDRRLDGGARRLCGRPGLRSAGAASGRCLCSQWHGADGPGRDRGQAASDDGRKDLQRLVGAVPFTTAGSSPEADDRRQSQLGCGEGDAIAGAGSGRSGRGTTLPAAQLRGEWHSPAHQSRGIRHRLQGADLR